jgi:hypothetical protein
MIHYLKTTKCSQGPNNEKKRYFILRAIPYVILDGKLYRMKFHGVLLRCIESDKINKVLEEFHNGTTGGHLIPRNIILKNMRVGYYGPNLYSDAYAWVIKCKQCAIFVGK